MTVFVTRESVAAGDDVFAPHAKTFSIGTEEKVEHIIAEIVNAAYLPAIAGGAATWVAASNVPIAVIAQQWDKAKMLSSILEHQREVLDVRENVLRIHFNYLAQVDPDVVSRIFIGFRLTAPD